MASLPLLGPRRAADRPAVERLHLLRRCRCRTPSPASTASAFPCSWTNGPFIRISACGANVLTGRTAHVFSVSGWSNASSIGRRTFRLLNRYIDRRVCCVASGVTGHRPSGSPSVKIRSYTSGSSGTLTDGPPTCRFSVPAAARTESRIASASSRRRFIRHSSLLSGSAFAPRAGGRGLAVGRARDDQPVDVLEDQGSRSVTPDSVLTLPASSGSPVRTPASRAAPGAWAARRGVPKSFGVADEPAAEVVLPEPVHDHPGRQRVVRAASATSPVRGASSASARRPSTSTRGNAGADGQRLARRVAALQHERLRPASPVLDRPRGRRSAAACWASSSCSCSRSAARFSRSAGDIASSTSSQLTLISVFGVARPASSAPASACRPACRAPRGTSAPASRASPSRLRAVRGVDVGDLLLERGELRASSASASFLRRLALVGVAKSTSAYSAAAKNAWRR